MCTCAVKGKYTSAVPVGIKGAMSHTTSIYNNNEYDD